MKWQSISAGLVLFIQSSWTCGFCAEKKYHPKQQGDYVVLLHGLGRSRLSMKRLEWALAEAGFRVVNASYPSTRLSVENAANDWLAGLLEERTPDRSVKIHFVTHSLGGIVLRHYLLNHKLDNLGRVVMLAPPNRGSELADKLKHNIVFKLLTGPAGQQLGTDSGSLPNSLGPACFELGIIAGERSFNPWFSAWLPGPNDGKVSVQSAALEGMRDFLIVPHSHTWMAWSKEVAAAVIQFVQNGHFLANNHGLQLPPGDGSISE